MKFESAKEAMEWVAFINETNIAASGSFFVSETDPDMSDIDRGPKIRNTFEDAMITKIDLENIIESSFPQKWVQELLFHWALDGYADTINKWFPLASELHASMGIRTRKDKLEAWIQRLDHALYKKKYLKNGMTYQEKVNVNFSA